MKIKQQPHQKDPFPLIEKENLPDIIILSGPPTNDLKYTVNQVFNLHDPLDTIPLSKLEVEKNFLPSTETITLQLLQNTKTLTLLLDNSSHGTNIKQNQQKLIQQF